LPATPRATIVPTLTVYRAKSNRAQLLVMLKRSEDEDDDDDALSARLTFQHSIATFKVKYAIYA